MFLVTGKTSLLLRPLAQVSIRCVTDPQISRYHLYTQVYVFGFIFKYRVNQFKYISPQVIFASKPNALPAFEFFSKLQASTKLTSNVQLIASLIGTLRAFDTEVIK